MGLQLKAGTRLRSVTDTTEVVVVKTPAEPVDLRCGGRPLVTMDAEVTTVGIEAGFDGGTQLGKRYADEDLGLELLCTKAGKGSLQVNGVVIGLKQAKALPASD